MRPIARDPFFGTWYETDGRVFAVPRGEPIERCPSGAHRAAALARESRPHSFVTITKATAHQARTLSRSELPPGHNRFLVARRCDALSFVTRNWYHRPFGVVRARPWRTGLISISLVFARIIALASLQTAFTSPISLPRCHWRCVPTQLLGGCGSVSARRRWHRRCDCAS